MIHAKFKYLKAHFNCKIMINVDIKKKDVRVS